MGAFRFKSDLRNHQAIIQPRLYECLMVTQITLSWLAWNYSALLSQPITSMPPLDVGQSEQWATACYNKLCAVDLRP